MAPLSGVEDIRPDWGGNTALLWPFAHSLTDRARRKLAGNFCAGATRGIRGSPESAARRADGIANIAYDNPDAKIAAAFTYLLLGDYSRAWEELSDAQSIRSTPRAYLLQGWAMLQEAEALNKDGDRKGAADSARTALQYYRVAVDLAPKAHWAVPAGQVIRTLERLVGGR